MTLARHRFNHTTDSLPIGAGDNVKVVQRMLGQAAMALDGYGYLLNDDLCDVADVLANAIEGPEVALPFPGRKWGAESGRTSL